MKNKKLTIKITIIMLVAFVVRMLIAYFTQGFKGDISLFSDWAIKVTETGMAKFYSPNYFCDYLPGYVNVLYVLGIIKKVFLLSDTSLIWIALIKTPSIIADMLLALFSYKIAKNKWGEKQALFILLVMVFNPLLIFNSSVWGQTDSILILCLVLTFHLYFHNKKIIAGLLYGITILIKTQALMLGPILAIMYIYDIIKNKDFRTIRDTLLAIGAAFGAIFLVSFPYKGEQDFFWIIPKIFSVTGGYPYTSINASNFQLAIFGNWTPITEKFFAIPLIIYGFLGIILSYAFSFFLFIKCKIKDSKIYMLIATIFLFGVYMLGPYMHERYLLPVPFFFLFTYIEWKNKKIIWAIIATTLICLLNLIIVYILYNTPYLPNANPMLRGLSYIAIIVFNFSMINITEMIWREGKSNEKLPKQIS